MEPFLCGTYCTSIIIIYLFFVCVGCRRDLAWQAAALSAAVAEAEKRLTVEVEAVETTRDEALKSLQDTKVRERETTLSGGGVYYRVVL